MLNSIRLARLLTHGMRACTIVLLTFTFTAVAAAQDAPSLVDLKAAAYDAQQASADAEQAAAQAASQAAEAKTALEEANAAAQQAPPPAPVVQAAPAPQVIVVQTPAPVAPAPPPVPAAAPAPGEEPVTREELERAMEKAEHAAAAARRVEQELEAYKEQHKKRYARNGLTLSAGAFWAPDLFEVPVNADPSLGLSGGLGYRVHPHFSIETSFVWADGFAMDFYRWDGTSVLPYEGDMQMWSVLFGGKLYVLTGKIQPYLGLGFGAAGARGTFESPTGAPTWEYKEVAGNIAFNGGVDLYVSESLALGLDAAIYLPGGNISGFNFSTLGAKLIYRF